MISCVVTYANRYVDRILAERDVLQEQLKEAQRHMAALKSENKKLISASK